MGKELIYWEVILSNLKRIYSSQCEWTQLPKLAIDSIKLHLPNKKIIVFRGFEEYLVIRTYYKLLQTKCPDRLETINILGKKKEEVCQISWHYKGKVLQTKTKYSNWKPLRLETLPKRDPTEKKRFQIKYSKSQPTNLTDWHIGVWMPKASVSVETPKY